MRACQGNWKLFDSAGARHHGKAWLGGCERFECDSCLIQVENFERPAVGLGDMFRQLCC